MAMKLGWASSLSSICCTLLVVDASTLRHPRLYHRHRSGRLPASSLSSSSSVLAESLVMGNIRTIRDNGISKST